MPVPVWEVFGRTEGRVPSLILVPAYDGAPIGEDEPDDVLSLSLTPGQYQGKEVPAALRTLTWDSIVSEALFGADHPPRYVGAHVRA